MGNNKHLAILMSLGLMGCVNSIPEFQPAVNLAPELDLSESFSLVAGTQNSLTLNVQDDSDNLEDLLVEVEVLSAHDYYVDYGGHGVLRVDVPEVEQQVDPLQLKLRLVDTKQAANEYTLFLPIVRTERVLIQSQALTGDGHDLGILERVNAQLHTFAANLSASAIDSLVIDKHIKQIAWLQSDDQGLDQLSIYQQQQLAAIDIPLVYDPSRGIEGQLIDLNWSPNAQVLAIITDTNDNGFLEVKTWANDSDLATPLSDQFSQFIGGFDHLNWSPDNTQLLLGGETKPLSVLNTVTGDINALSSNGVDESDIAWSADGAFVATLSEHTDSQALLQVFDANQITSTPVWSAWVDESAAKFQWSPVASQIAFVSEGHLQVVDLESVSVSTIDACVSTRCTFRRLSWSGDGSRIGFEMSPTGRIEYEIYSASLESDSRIVHSDYSFFTDIVYWQWLADTQHMLVAEYERNQTRVRVYSVQTDSNNVFSDDVYSSAELLGAVTVDSSNVLIAASTVLPLKLSDDQTWVALRNFDVDTQTFGLKLFAIDGSLSHKLKALPGSDVCSSFEWDLNNQGIYWQNCVRLRSLADLNHFELLSQESTALLADRVEAFWVRGR